MNLGELAALLVKQAKQYRKQLVTEEVPKFKGQSITDEVVRRLLYPYLSMVQAATPEDVAYMLGRRFTEFVPQAVETVRLDSHMNVARGASVLDENWAEALLVSFVNEACTPLDLALYTRDLQTEN